MGKNAIVLISKLENNPQKLYARTQSGQEDQGQDTWNKAKGLSYVLNSTQLVIHL